MSKSIINHAKKINEIYTNLKNNHHFSDDSIDLLKDKGFDDPDSIDLLIRFEEIMNMKAQTFEERRKEKNSLENLLDKGDSLEITTGRYNRMVENFNDISSEQALVRGRIKFGVEYVIRLAKLICMDDNEKQFIPVGFSNSEKEKLRSMYKTFLTKDYLAIKTLERKTNHDIVAANTNIILKGDQIGLDGEFLRKIVHFSRTSADVNANVVGELYMKSIGKWGNALADLIETLQTKAKKYKNMTCVARTHGQDAQLTTMGLIYAKFANQIIRQAKPLLMDEMFRIEGKIGGAIGTDVDFIASFNINPEKIYSDIVENVFGLKFNSIGDDQDSSNAELSRALNVISDTGDILEKIALDTWLYASRMYFTKKPKKGESGSSAMPQKANPFLAEGCAALMNIVRNTMPALKQNKNCYFEQGDLRRSITEREIFHPIMLSTIGINRLINELNKYEPNLAIIERDVYQKGPKVIASAISNYLRSKGMSDGYDRIKELTTKPYVTAKDYTSVIEKNIKEGLIDNNTGNYIEKMILSVVDKDNNFQRFIQGEESLYKKLVQANENKDRKKLIGNAIYQTNIIVENCEDAVRKLRRYDLKYGG
jgi:adenylosuccinate lyase